VRRRERERERELGCDAVEESVALSRLGVDPTMAMECASLPLVGAEEGNAGGISGP
jgi:hypothetical protein